MPPSMLLTVLLHQQLLLRLQLHPLYPLQQLQQELLQLLLLLVKGPPQILLLQLQLGCWCCCVSFALRLLPWLLLHLLLL